MFLETLSSYLPDDFIGEKICKTTGSLKEVWNVIDDFYGVKLSSETFLGLTKLTKKSDETYRQFYLRLEGFVSKHLTKGGVKVEELEVPARSDQVTISMKNLIVIIWMTKIHPKLVDCVKVDFAQELRGGKELIELMGRIADNVDNILARHDISGAVAMVTEDETGDNMHQGMINKMDYGQRGQRGRGGGRGGFSNRGRPGRQDQSNRGNGLKCAHCDYLAQTLRLKINTNHEAQECWRKDIAVRMMSVDDAVTDSFSSAEDQGAQIQMISSFLTFKEI